MDQTTIMKKESWKIKKKSASGNAGSGRMVI
jgi:hypothetical protein